MKKYEVTGRVFKIKTGIIELSEKQYLTRSHCLKIENAKKGIYRIIDRIEFICGEIIGLDDEINKGEIANITAVDVKEKKGKVADAVLD